MELQAQLYQTQEQARMRADGLPGVQDRHVRRKAGGSGSQVYSSLRACASAIATTNMRAAAAAAAHAENNNSSSELCICCRTTTTTKPPAIAAGIDVASIKNKGVEAREARDRALALESNGSGAERLAESRAALQRKAALYDRLAAQGGTGDDEQDEKYEVRGMRNSMEQGGRVEV